MDAEDSLAENVSARWTLSHDYVIKWKHYPRYWPFVRVTSVFPSQKPVTRNFDVFFDLRLDKQLFKQSRSWWFETPSRSLWRQCNAKNPISIPNALTSELSRSDIVYPMFFYIGSGSGHGLLKTLHKCGERQFILISAVSRFCLSDPQSLVPPPLTQHSQNDLESKIISHWML